VSIVTFTFIVNNLYETYYVFKRLLSTLVHHTKIHRRNHRKLHTSSACRW